MGAVMLNRKSCCAGESSMTKMPKRRSWDEGAKPRLGFFLFFPGSVRSSREHDGMPWLLGYGHHGFQGQTRAMLPWGLGSAKPGRGLGRRAFFGGNSMASV